MPTTRSPWRASAVAIPAAISPAGWLAALNDLIAAEVAANPATAQWTVSDYDAVNGTLELKKLQTVDNVRILLFGGQVPHTNALWQTQSSASFLHGCICPTAGTDGPDADYTLAAPYTDPSTLGAAFLSTVAASGQTIANRLRYWENSSSVVIMGHNNVNASHTGCLIIGDLMDDPSSGDPVYAMLASGATSSTTSSYSARLTPNAISGSLRTTSSITAFATDTHGRFWNHTIAKNSDLVALGLPNSVALRAGAPAQLTGPHFGGADYNSAAGAIGGMTPNLKDTPSAVSYLIPVPFCSITTVEFIGHLRQIMVGPRAAIGHILTKDGSPYARAISANPINAADALWLVD